MTKRFLLAAAFVMSAAAALAEGDVTKEKFSPFFTREEAPHLEHVLPEPPSLTDPLFHNDWSHEMNLEEQVKAMLDALRPMLQNDGGDLEFVKMEGKVVTLKLVGHCGSCPYAMLTLKQGIEAKLQELDPELTVERAE